MNYERIEAAAFQRHYPPGYLHDAVDTPADLARMRGVTRQRLMLIEYAQRKAQGEFHDGPEVRGMP